MIPPLPEGYDKVLLAPGNRIVAMGPPNLPILYLDEAAMQWRVLDRHISELA